MACVSASLATRNCLLVREDTLAGVGLRGLAPSEHGSSRICVVCVRSSLAQGCQFLEHHPWSRVLGADRRGQYQKQQHG
jgi:hypothetical protein